MDRGYPAARERNGDPAVTLTDRFSSIEATAGYITLGDTLALVIAFTGRPLRLEVTVELNDAVIELRSELNVSEDPITVRAGQTWRPDVDTRYCFARNAVPAAVSRVQVIGRY